MFKFIGDLFLREKVYLNDKHWISVRRGVAEEVRGILDSIIVSSKLLDYKMYINSNFSWNGTEVYINLSKKEKLSETMTIKFFVTNTKRWYQKVQFSIYSSGHTRKTNNVYKYNLVDALERIRCQI